MIRKSVLNQDRDILLHGLAKNFLLEKVIESLVVLEFDVDAYHNIIDDLEILLDSDRSEHFVIIGRLGGFEQELRLQIHLDQGFSLLQEEVQEELLLRFGHILLELSISILVIDGLPKLMVHLVINYHRHGLLFLDFDHILIIPGDVFRI